MNPIVRIETYRTTGSVLLILAHILYAMPYHSFLGISMQHTAATI